MASVELMVVGNGLLNGDVLDANSHRLCRRLTHLGASVRRSSMVRDDPQAIADGLAEAGLPVEGGEA